MFAVLLRTLDPEIQVPQVFHNVPAMRLLYTFPQQPVHCRGGHCGAAGMWTREGLCCREDDGPFTGHIPPEVAPRHWPNWQQARAAACLGIGVIADEQAGDGESITDRIPSLLLGGLGW